MVQTKLRLLSADTHIVEPPGLWTSRIDPKFRARAPRVVRRDNADWWIVEENQSVGSIGNSTHSGERFHKRPEEISLNDTWENVRPGAYNPHEAIKDMELDGVEGGVIFPTKAGRGLWVVQDSELFSAICRAYNDWVADFCRPYPERLKAAAMINLDDLQEGVQELHRAKKLGLEAALITVHPAHERPYHIPDYDPFWQAAQDLNMPVCLHSGTNRTLRDGFPMDSWDQSDPHEVGEVLYTNSDYWIRRSLTSIILSKVFERYPRLKVVSVENQAGWVAHWLFRVELRYRDRGTRWGRFEGDMKPSDFFHRNCAVSFQDDWTAVATRGLIGADNLLWGSDYPHGEGTWPESQRVVREIFHDASEEDLRKITYLNTARVFGFPVSANQA